MVRKMVKPAISMKSAPAPAPEAPKKEERPISDLSVPREFANRQEAIAAFSAWTRIQMDRWSATNRMAFTTALKEAGIAPIVIYSLVKINKPISRGSATRIVKLFGFDPAAFEFVFKHLREMKERVKSESGRRKIISHASQEACLAQFEAQILADLSTRLRVLGITEIQGVVHPDGSVAWSIETRQKKQVVC